MSYWLFNPFAGQIYFFFLSQLLNVNKGLILILINILVKHFHTDYINIQHQYILSFAAFQNRAVVGSVKTGFERHDCRFF